MNIKHVRVYELFFSIPLSFTKPPDSAPKLGTVLIGQFMALIFWVTKNYIIKNTKDFLLGLRKNSVYEKIQMELNVCLFKASENRLNLSMQEQ